MLAPLQESGYVNLVVVAFDPPIMSMRVSGNGELDTFPLLVALVSELVKGTEAYPVAVVENV